METKKKKSYQLRQNGKKYILTTSTPKENAVKMDVTSITERYFSREFTLDELKSLDAIFSLIKSSSDAIDFIDKALRQEKVEIKEYGGFVFIIFYFFSKGIVNKVIIPLGKLGSKLKLISPGKISSDKNVDEGDFFGKLKSLISTSKDKKNIEEFKYNAEQEDININEITDITKSHPEFTIKDKNINRYNLDIDEIETNKIGPFIEGANTASSTETSQYYQNNLEQNVVTGEIMKSLQPNVLSYKNIDGSSLEGFDSQYSRYSVPLPFYDGNQFIDKLDSATQFIPSYGTSSVEVPFKSSQYITEDITNKELMTQDKFAKPYITGITDQELMTQDKFEKPYITAITDQELMTQDKFAKPYITGITDQELMTQEQFAKPYITEGTTSEEFMTQDQFGKQYITATKDKFTKPYITAITDQELMTQEQFAKPFTTEGATSEELMTKDKFAKPYITAITDQELTQEQFTQPFITEGTMSKEVVTHDQFKKPFITATTDLGANQFIDEAITNKELITQDFATNQYITEDITNKDLITEDFALNQFRKKDSTTYQIQTDHELMTQDKFTKPYITAITDQELTQEQFTQPFITEGTTSEQLIAQDKLAKPYITATTDQFAKPYITAITGQELMTQEQFAKPYVTEASKGKELITQDLSTTQFISEVSTGKELMAQEQFARPFMTEPSLGKELMAQDLSRSQYIPEETTQKLYVKKDLTLNKFKKGKAAKKKICKKRINN